MGGKFGFFCFDFVKVSFFGVWIIDCDLVYRWDFLGVGGVEKMGKGEVFWDLLLVKFVEKFVRIGRNFVFVVLFFGIGEIFWGLIYGCCMKDFGLKVRFFGGFWCGIVKCLLCISIGRDWSFWYCVGYGEVFWECFLCLLLCCILLVRWVFLGVVGSWFCVCWVFVGSWMN